MKHSLVKTSALTCLLFGALTTAQSNTILIQDTFDRATDGGSLADDSPTTDNLDSYTWTSRFGDVARTTGGQLISKPDTGLGRTSYIQLSSTYFNDNPNQYSLSFDLTLESGSSTDNWVGLGFITGPDQSLNMATTDQRGGEPWIKLDQAGNLNVYLGRGTQNSVYSGSGYTSGQLYSFELVLDTTQTNWSVAAFVNDVQLDLNSGDAGSLLASYDTNPTGLTSVGFSPFSSGAAGSFTITGDNFTLSTIPEPHSFAFFLGLGSLLGVCKLRRR